MFFLVMLRRRNPTTLCPCLEWLVRGDQKRVDDGARMKSGASSQRKKNGQLPRRFSRWNQWYLVVLEILCPPNPPTTDILLARNSPRWGVTPPTTFAQWLYRRQLISGAYASWTMEKKFVLDTLMAKASLLHCFIPFPHDISDITWCHDFWVRSAFGTARPYSIRMSARDHRAMANALLELLSMDAEARWCSIQLVEIL